MAEQQKILVVDDERFNVNLMVDLLKPDYKMMVAKNGEQALKAARSASPPDLVLLDIMMPEMDGYEVCRRLKADEATCDIPIIFVSAMGEDADETRGLELGAVDYITKPISPPIVQARVKTHLALKRHMEELQQASRVIEAQKDRMQAELNIGRDIQMGLVPCEFPEHEAFSLSAILKPARELGGDLYDFFFIDDDLLCLVLGDVSGKGVPSALFMAVAKTLIRSMAMESTSTGVILSKVNSELSRNNESCMFVTTFVAVLDIQSGRLRFSNAGHNRPYVRHKDGKVECLEQLHGPAVGVVSGVEYDESVIEMSPGDKIITYSDGVTEAMDPDDALFSDQRFLDLLVAQGDGDVAAVIDSTLSEIERFIRGAEQSDDITMLVLEFTGLGEGMGHLLDMSITNQVPELEMLNDRFAGFAREHGVVASDVQRINMCLDELLTNVISYAWPDGGEHKIEFKAVLQGDEMSIQIVDDGAPFNPFSVETPDTDLSLEERDPGGLGIHLVRSTMEQCHYHRRANRNVVVISKKVEMD